MGKKSWYLVQTTLVLPYSSVIKPKGESQNGCFKKKKHTKFSKKRTFLTAWYAHVHEKCSYSELFWSGFSRIWTKYGEVLRVSLYSVRMWENTDHNNSKYKNFLHSGIFLFLLTRSFYQKSARPQTSQLHY